MAQTKEHEKEVAVVEVGAAVSQSVKGDGFSGGADFAVEFTPIEDKLEMEAGVSGLFNRLSTEWDTDLLFKKPWTLSKKVEFMAGAGPEWIHTNENHISANAVGVEAIGDFMFCPTANHKLGWYLEPGYDYSFGRGHEQSIGIRWRSSNCNPKAAIRMSCQRDETKSRPSAMGGESETYGQAVSTTLQSFRRG